MTDSVYWIWFQIVFGVGTRSAEIMMRFFENPEEIAAGIGSDKRVTAMLEEVELERARGAMETAKRIQERTLKKGCEIITPDSPLYPEGLRAIYSKPAALYVKGDLSCLKDSLAMSMVGSRSATKYGLDAAKYISSGLAEKGVVIVSGLANGIDAVCHTAAVDAGGKTIGILGCGIDIDYPKGSAAMKRRVSENGAVVAEYPLGEPPLAFHFPIRNRIIAGISRGTVVIEAGEKSGSLVTADLAMEQGRDIFAVPGNIFLETYKGANRLIKEGCKPVTCAMDILEEYFSGLNITDSHNRHDESVNNNLEEYNEPKISAIPAVAVKRKPAPDTLSEMAVLVYEKIGAEPKCADEIISEMDIGAGKVLASLTELEILGLIQIFPGRLFGLNVSDD